MESCQSLVAKMRSCQLVNEVEDRCEDARGATDIGNCFVDCLSAGACRDVETVICELERELTDTTRACRDECSRRFAFHCGDGELIDQDFVCDLEADCDDASDEMGCDYFRCADGRALRPTWICDGEADCPDSSDEADCPTFTCDNGVTVPGLFVCDGEFDCADGSDEEGCRPRTRYICPNEGQ